MGMVHIWNIYIAAGAHHDGLLIAGGFSLSVQYLM